MSRIADAATVAAVDEFTREVALLFFRMTVAAQEFLGLGTQSAGRRSVLKSLLEEGPQTVPQMARVRAVSRQHLQTLVNALRNDGLVRLRNNPAHKRSRLVDLTAAGRRFALAMQKREERLWSFVAADLPLADLKTATEVARAIKVRFESEEWADFVKEWGG